MPLTQINAQTLVRRARVVAGLPPLDLVRDGFAEDDGSAPISLIEELTAIYAELGINTNAGATIAYLAVQAGVNEYTLPANLGEVRWVSWRGDARGVLTRTTLRAIHDSGETDSASNPDRWYMDRPGVIGLFPAPAATDTVATPGAPTAAEASIHVSVVYGITAPTLPTDTIAMPPDIAYQLAAYLGYKVAMRVAAVRGTETPRELHAEGNSARKDVLGYLSDGATGEGVYISPSSGLEPM